MQYLGRIAGGGLLIRDGKTVARASYEFEGFARPRGSVTSSGEISMSRSDLKTVFGRPRVQLLTDEGRLLDLRFSEKELRYAEGVAQVEVTGDLPDSSAEWRGGSTAERSRASPAHSPEAAATLSEKAGSISWRRRTSA